MKLGTYLKKVRVEKLKISQEAMGKRGLVSTPGWIKIENGQRTPSDRLIGQLAAQFVADKVMKPGEAKTFTEEALTLKYLQNKSAFLVKVVTAHAKSLPNGEALLAKEAKDAKAPRPKGQGLPPAMKAANALKRESEAIEAQSRKQSVAA